MGKVSDEGATQSSNDPILFGNLEKDSRRKTEKRINVENLYEASALARSSQASALWFLCMTFLFEWKIKSSPLLFLLHFP